MTMELSKNASLMDMINSDDALFHYTKRSTALEMVLSKNTFKLFHLLNTNDPREYKDRLQGVTGWNWSNETEELIKQVHTYFDALLRNYSYFSSFTENKYIDNKLHSHGYIKPRMWAQYGEDHYGVCLVFSKQNFIDAIHDSIDRNNFCVFNDSILYKESDKYSRSQSMSIDGDSFVSSTPFKIAFEHIKKYNKELFFQKDIDYRDEDEYRVVVCRSKENSEASQSLDIQATNCIKGIILGDRFPRVYKPTIEQLCKELKIEYKKFHFEKRNYILLSTI